MANIVNARDKNNNIVYPITKTSLVLDNNGTSVDILLAGKQASLTSAQMTAANSGITSALVAQITTNATNIGTLQTDVSSLQTTVSNKMDKDNPTGTGSFSLNRLVFGTTGSYSSTLGRYNTASGSYSHAAGYYTTAQRRSQQTFGEYNILDDTGSSTSSKGSFIEIVGNGTSTTNRSNARTLDWSGNEVLAGNLRAAGLTDGTTTKTMTEILAGGGSTITVDSALSTTSENPVQNKVITNALGDKMDKNNPVGTGTFSMNRLTNSAIGAESSTLGIYNTASGSASHAEGYGNSSTGQQSHAEGYTNTASGNNSHAEGGNNTASGGSSHVEGVANTASGSTSHAEGFTTMAIGNYSHSEGYGTRANRQSQHVFGEFNIVDNSGSSGASRGDYVEIVGNGTADNARSNARTLDWSGNETLAGWLTMGSNSYKAVAYDPNSVSTTEATLLDNYYTKSQTYSQSEVNTLLNGKIGKAVNLWNNPNLGYSFGAQAITLNESVRNYDYIMILFREYTTDERVNIQFFRTFENVTQNLFYALCDVTDSGVLVRSRNFAIWTGGTQIYFETGMSALNNSMNASSSAMVPYSIFGINL